MASSNGTGSQGGDPKPTGLLGAGSDALRRMMSGQFGFQKDAVRSLMDDGGAHGAGLGDDVITSLLEAEIIPRLLMAHSDQSMSLPGSSSRGIAPTEAQRFALLPLRLEAANLLDEVERFLEAGISVDVVLVDLLAPAARRLGEMWESDECDFLDVTMGLWRLQEVMRDVAARANVPRRSLAEDAGRALFVAMPGDQHGFGAIMVDEVFAQAGWDSTALAQPRRSEILEALSRRAYDVVGLTVSRSCPSSALSNLIKAMRKASANPDIFVLVGGHMINQNPATVTEVGADGTGADARAALEVAEALVQSATVRAYMMR